MFEKARASAIRALYTGIAEPILFSFDPERVHNQFIRTGAFLGSSAATKAMTRAAFDYENRALEQKLAGLRFRNPVGLSAGFDKNGEAAAIMEDVGFGFTEVGSVTALPCKGNKGVRLKRLPERKSLWVHLGLNNKGALAVHDCLKGKRLRIPVGISAAMTNCKETADPDVGLHDYLFTLKTFRDIADYFDLNISCPNAFGAQAFADPKLFRTLARQVSGLGLKQPVFVKISPDLTKGNVDSIIGTAAEYGLAGFICTNLSKRHGFSEGGLSGKAVEKKANDMLAYVYRRAKRTGRNFVIVGVGGIFSAEDAYRKIRLGANLVQLITGMIYQGPELIGEINRGLVELMRVDGFSRIGEAVGSADRPAS